MKEIKVNYVNGEELTWMIWDYEIEDGKLIYSSASDNSINIIKMDKIKSIEVDGEIVFDECSEFRKELDNYIRFFHTDRVVDIDIWKDEYFYIAVVIEISKNHEVYRYIYHSDVNEINIKYDSVEVFS